MALALAACSTPAAKPTATPANKAAEVVAEAEIVDDFNGDGMEIPLDGTSAETFEASLQMVQRHTDEDNYISLRKAINYLLVYDLGAKRDMAKLASRLNGLNGYEVLAKVGWYNSSPPKKKVEKGAADGKIIET
jgi:hypothetical protein